MGSFEWQGSYSSGKTWKRGLFGINQGKHGKLRELSDHFYNLRENSGNFILPNISDQIGGTLRINEYRKNDLMLIMTPEKQDNTLELSKHWSVDSTPARNEVIMKRTYPVKSVKCDKICSNY